MIPAPDASLDGARVADEAEQVLRRDVLAPWFPAAVDARGGFHEHYGEDWSRLDDGDARSLVYQARLTWMAAAASAGLDDGRETHRAINRHGLAFLSARQWDADHGGFFWSVDPQGAPQGAWATEKHAYGQGFAIFAAAASYAATGDAAALELAKAAFAWLDDHGRDREHGGYFEVLSRQGAPLARPGRERDAIGTPYGQKSMNTHLHLLEAFSALHAVWPDPQVQAALGEVFDLVRDRGCARAGTLVPLFTADWRPASRRVSYGHDVEAAHLLHAAAEALGPSERAPTLAIGRRLVDHALRSGYDRAHGGFFHGRSPRTWRRDKTKIWWVQAEALPALLLMHKGFGAESAAYASAFQGTWAFILARQIDGTHGGWRPRTTAAGAPLPGPKSDGWTDPYHQGRALLAVIAALRP